MNKFSWTQAFLAAFVALSVGSVFAAPTSEEVQFKAVNPVVQSLVDAVISADDTVDFTYPRFDEKFSSLDAERIKYDAKGALKNTPWLEGGRADFAVTSTYVVERNRGESGIRMKAASTVKTDALAMIRYAGYLGLKHSNHKNPKFKERLDAHLKRLAVVQSLDEVHPLLLSGHQLGKDMAADELLKKEEYLKCLQSGSCKGWPDQNAAIAEAKKTVECHQRALRAFDSVEIETKKDGERITEIKIRTPDLAQFLIWVHKTDLLPGRIQTTITEENIVSEADAFFRASIEDLDKNKKKVKEHLIGLQNGDIEKKDKTQRELREGLKAYKEFIRGEI